MNMKQDTCTNTANMRPHNSINNRKIYSETFKVMLDQ